ncbi:MAG: hypothetical protein K5851_01140, partial [Lachnospiraceae bacterium]|nr:hypothetical protein [Lachnospiraceae bacterium]
DTVEEGQVSEEGKEDTDTDDAESEEDTENISEAESSDETEESTEEETTVEETTVEETTIEETTVAETTVPETTVAETTVAAQEYLTAEDISGTWDIDDLTTYSFSEDGDGKLILPEHTYAFTFKFEENKLSIDFEKSNVRDSNYIVSIDGDTLVLECTDEDYENTFHLSKN